MPTNMQNNAAPSFSRPMLVRVVIQLLFLHSRISSYYLTQALSLENDYRFCESVVDTTKMRYSYGLSKEDPHEYDSQMILFSL